MSGSATKLGDTIQRPLTKDNLGAFLNCENKEKVLAGYLGFENVCDLRNFALSWPVLKALAEIAQYWANLHRDKVFTLILTEEHNITAVEKPQDKWGRHEDDSAEMVIKKRYHWITWIILELEKDVHTYCNSTESQNRTWAKEYHKKFQAAAKKETFSKKPCTFEIQTEKLEFPIPRLGPLGDRGEIRIERANRCFEILKYVRSVAACGAWGKRFASANVIANGKKLKEKDIPLWMRPKEQTDSDLPELSLAPKGEPKYLHHPIEVTIHWDRNKKFPEWAEAEAALDTAVENGLFLPLEIFKLQWDPRLCTSIKMFRDMLRRQCDCNALGIDLYGASLEYYDTEAERKVTLDTRQVEWSLLERAFSDGQNSAFILHVQFKAKDDPEDEIFELLDLPPWMDSTELPKTELEPHLPQTGRKRKLSESPPLKPAEACIGQTMKVQAPQPTVLHGEPTDVNTLLLKGESSINISDYGVNPKQFDKREKLLRYYSGYDVTKEDERRQWQQMVFSRLKVGSSRLESKADKVPLQVGANKRQRDILAGAEQQALRDAEAEVKPKADHEYYTLQSAFSGASKRAGPPLDVCLDLLLSVQATPDRYRLELLDSYVKGDFYHYQITGAVGMVLKLFGKISPEPLLRLANISSDDPRAHRVTNAAHLLKDVSIGGVLNADDIGFGKTKQCLLAALLYSLLAKENKPTLLLVPATLINQWCDEIRDYWPFFRPILSYSQDGFTAPVNLDTLGRSAMSNLGRKIPPHLQYLFDNKDAKGEARKSIIISSYETHRSRTAKYRTETKEGVRHTPPRYGKDGKEIFKQQPKEVKVLYTNHVHKFGLLIADEAHKVKNANTDIWTLLTRHLFENVILATATPMFNTIEDLQGLTYLLGQNSLSKLENMMKHNENDRKVCNELITSIKKDTSGAARLLDKTCDSDDLRRVVVLRPELVRLVSKATQKDKPFAASYFGVILDLIAIQRSEGSEIPCKDSPPVSLNGLCRKAIFKITKAPFLPSEKSEYQKFHMEAAHEYIEEMKTNAINQKGQASQASDKKNFSAGTRPLRKLAIASFATKLARLNQRVEQGGSSTLVKELDSWRARGHGAEYIYKMTRVTHVDPPELGTAVELLEYLVDGSPAIRCLLDQVDTSKVLEPLNKEKVKGHQKILCGVAVPVNAWYAQIVLQLALIGSATFHASLDQTQRSTLISDFNDTGSKLRVLIMQYDTGGCGLNLHKACNRVILLEAGRSRSQEHQLAGRAKRVTSEFNVTVTRRVTPDSHDQYRTIKQAEKACLQLATNAREPEIKALMVTLLNKLQPRVDMCHDSIDGTLLLRKLKDEEARMEKERRDYLDSQQEEYTGKKAPAGAEKQPSQYDPREYSQDYDTIDLDDDGYESSEPESKISEQEDPSWEPDDTSTQKELFQAPEDVDSEVDDESVSMEDDDSEAGSEIISERGDPALDSDGEDVGELVDTVGGLSSSALHAKRTSFDNRYAWKKFTDRNQPNDEDREKLALLSLPKHKAWSKEDLDDETYFVWGLRLLYNKAHGINTIHVDKSIHIRYDMYPSLHLPT